MYTNDDEVTNVDSSCGAAEDFFCSSYSAFWATGFSLKTFQHFGGMISSDCTRPRSVSMFRSSGWMDGKKTYQSPVCRPRKRSKVISFLTYHSQFPPHYIMSSTFRIEQPPRK